MARKKPKSDGSNQRAQPLPAPQDGPTSGLQPATLPFYKRAWPYITGTAVVVAWLLLNTPEVLQNLRGTPEEVRKTLTQYQSWLHEDSEWTGNWTASPEGVVDSADWNLSADDLQVTIWATGGDIDGTIATKRICETVPFDYVLLRGKVSGNHARVIAWDIVGGRKVAFAQLELERDGAIMTVTPLDGLVEWFPQTARIARDPLAEGAEPKPDTTFCDAQQRARVEPK